MTSRKPLVIQAGGIQQLADGDTLTTATPANNINNGTVPTTQWIWGSMAYLVGAASSSIPSGTAYQISNTIWIPQRSQGGATFNDWPRLPNDGWYRCTYNIKGAGTDFTYLLLTIQQLNAASSGWQTKSNVLQVNNNGSQFSYPTYSGCMDLYFAWGTQDKIVTYQLQQNNAANASRAIELNVSFQKLTF